ncbi:MAG TPA: hypothetical protein VNI84_02865 [Pyrinomonadaceae bacterium]|nr:hypothetical protein [Pyrinomonadaceae bacterium]
MKNKVNQVSLLIFLGVVLLFGSTQVLGRTISVEVLYSSQTPVRIISSSGKITKEGLKITYSLFASDAQELSGVKLLALRVNEKGKISGGNIWNEDKLAAGILKKSKYLLKGAFSDNERIILIPLKAQKRSAKGLEETRVNLDELVVTVKNYVGKGILPQNTKTTESEFNLVSSSEFEEEGTCDVATIAVTVCGKGCVKSVDCKNEAFVCKDTCSGSIE